jgi:Spy/CpxP family protein refolding chaperone
MFGILVGTGLVIAGTVVFVRHRHGYHRTMFGCALRRLNATAEQRQRLSSLFDEVHSRLSTAKERARSLRCDLAEILAAPAVDTQRLETIESQLFEVVGEGTQVLREVVARIHETLDPAQRHKLAGWLRRADRHHRGRCVMGHC